MDSKKLHGFFIEDLRVGQKASLTKKITETDINQFSEVTGDDNPVHINENFAKLSSKKELLMDSYLQV